MQKACILLLFIPLLLCYCGHDAGLSPDRQLQLPSDSSALPAPSNEEDYLDGFLKVFHGYLENGKEIDMLLVNWGNGFLNGRYWYTGTSINIELNGEMLDSAAFELIETQGIADTGSFRGKFSGPTSITGEWTNPGKNKRLSFHLTEVPSSDDEQHWTGIWHLNNIWDKGTLMIGNVSTDSFDFAINVLRNGHIGTIQDRAARYGAHASFLKKDYEDETCFIKMVHHGSYIEILQESSNFACGFGARAFAGGKYEDKYVRKIPTLGIGKDGIFADTALQQAFLEMVGDTNYETFAYNMQMTEVNKIISENSNTIKVVTGFVAGLPGTNEALIAYDNTGRMWAATLQPAHKGGDTVLLYFTTDKTQARHIPAFVESWRAGFKDYPVIYASH